MALNPLNFPKRPKKQGRAIPKKWSSVDAGKIPEAPQRPGRSPRLSRREELSIEAEKAENHIIIDVQGLDKLKSGRHKLPYRPDQPLRIYLHQAGLVMTGIKAAMYDTSNYEKGRLRTSYTPGPGVVILLCPTSYSPIHRERQSRKVDAERVMARMSDKTVSMQYGTEKTAEKKEPTDGVEQW